MVNFVEKNYIKEVGVYNVVISNIDLKETKNGLGKYFEFILENPEKASYVVRVNCENTNDKACEIGYGTLLKLLRALNEDNLIENCKYLEPKAKDYTELFKLIIENQLIGRINKETEFGLEIYNKKPKEVFNAITGQNEMATQLGEKFFSLKKEEPKLDDSIPC